MHLCVWHRHNYCFTFSHFPPPSSIGGFGENICSGVTAPAKLASVINYSHTTVTWILIKKNKRTRGRQRKTVIVIMCPVQDFSQVQIWVADKRPNVWQLLRIISWRASLSSQNDVHEIKRAGSLRSCLLLLSGLHHISLCAHACSVNYVDFLKHLQFSKIGHLKAWKLC